MTAMTATAYDLLAYDMTSNPQQPRPPPRDPNHSPPNLNVRATSLPKESTTMLTTNEITKLVAAPPSGLTAGGLAHLAQREKGKQTVKAEAFLRDAQQQHPVGTAPTAQTYAHPGRTPKDQRRGGGPLSAVEVAWLQRLPVDPARTPYGDAATVAALAADISRMEHPADGRLVDSHWTPIKDFHDGNAATIALANARSTPVPPVPPSAMAALAEAVTAEHPELTAGEATNRAKSMLDEAVAKRSAERQQTIESAQGTVAALAAATRARSATTR